MHITQPHHLDIERACIRLVLDAVHAVDQQKYRDFADCFSADGLLYRPGQTEPLRGPAAIQDAYESRPASRMTRHICTNMRVDIHSVTSSTVYSYVQLYAKDLSDADSSSAPALRVGEFEDHCVCQNGRWLIAERKARFVM